jgi:YegS/Rv2252/BmrU family lipid kinase
LRARLVFNPSAGMRVERAEIKRAVQVLRERGWTVDVVETSRGGDATALARQAAEEKFDALIAVGGDGTLNEAANGLVGTATALGVLPSGTANVWAKEMGLPLGDWAKAADRLADAEVRAIDVGQVQGPTIAPRVFLLWSGVGLDALITSNVEPQREMKRRLGALAFWLVGVRDAWNYRAQSTTLIVEGRRLHRRVILALAANVQLYAGIARLAPDARVDDGRLDFVVLNGNGFWATAWHMVRVLFRARARDPRVEILPATSLRVLGSDLAVHVDAEPIGHTPVEICVRPRALLVLVPRTANQTLFVKA